jgi:hypothetical protein
MKKPMALSLVPSRGPILRGCWVTVVGLEVSVPEVRSIVFGSTRVAVEAAEGGVCGDFVHVFGNNFMDENDLSCQFGLRKTSTKVVCILPPRIRGNVTVELSLVVSALHQREFNILVM